MKRRHAWFGGAGASSLLLAGCLFHQNTVPKPPPVALDTSNAAVAPVCDAEPLPPPPALPSDYHLRDATPAARVAGCANPGEEKPRAEARPAVAQRPAPEETEAPRPAPDAPLVAALRCALEKHPAEARRLLAKYEKNDRELLLSLLRLTADLGEGDPEKLPPEQASRTLEQLSAVTTNLRLRAPLALEKVCFCKKIQGFGRYAPVSPRTEFQAGCEGRPGERVQIYAEVRNFASRQAEGHYETILESKLEIRDEERREVAGIDLGRCVDRSQTPRQDYFLNFQLHVPAKLPPGLYTLWVKVKDVTTDPPREANCSLDFRVRAAGDEPRAEQ